MARRRKQSGAEDLMDLVATLPWWAGVLLAIVSYVLLHQLSPAPTPAAMQPGQMGAFVQRGMLASFAMAAQLAVPPLCLLAALVSFIRRKKRRTLVDNVSSSKSADALNAMSWREFELLVGEAFRLRGYKVEEQGGAQADGGVDLVLRKDGETFLVQCKQWKAFKVGVEIVRELFGVMAANGATGGRRDVGHVHRGCRGVHARPQHHVGGRDSVVRHDPAGEAVTGRECTGVAVRNQIPGRGCASVSCVQCDDGAQDGAEGQQGRHAVLGLLDIPGVPGNPVNASHDPALVCLQPQQAAQPNSGAGVW